MIKPLRLQEKMANNAAVQQTNGGNFVFSSLYSYTNTRKDGLRNSIDRIFENGGSWNPVLLSFVGNFHESSSLIRKRYPIDDDILIGIGMATFFMRGLVSAVSFTARAPFERVKLLLQNQQELIKCGKLSRPYRGISDCFVRLVKNEGVFSLWRGNSVNLIRVFPVQALNVFSGYVVRGICVGLTKDRVGCETYLKTLVAHTCLYSCLYPLKYARTRLACDIKSVKNGGGRQFNGLFDVYRKTFKSDGLVGIYRGFFVGYIGLIINHSHNLACGGSPTKSDPSKKFSADAALMIGLLGILAAYPFETVQRRMMMTCGEALKYKNSFEALVQIIKNEGILSLYKGYGACLLGMVPMYLVMAGHKKLESRPLGSISIVIGTK
ncbi:ADP,ATP carrier protein-like [Primulina huaijiensis]|uniref:ADP,ATP carrier protein-like n=1 Tax=Primulina huaijiensis TaxID=1492673 RepID=UPI003CC73813